MFLVDNNLSFRICPMLKSTFDGIIHLSDIRLKSKDDITIWIIQNLKT